MESTGNIIVTDNGQCLVVVHRDGACVDSVKEVLAQLDKRLEHTGARMIVHDFRGVERVGEGYLRAIRGFTPESLVTTLAVVPDHWLRMILRALGTGQSHSWRIVPSWPEDEICHEVGKG